MSAAVDVMMFLFETGDWSNWNLCWWRVGFWHAAWCLSCIQYVFTAASVMNLYMSTKSLSLPLLSVYSFYQYLSLSVYVSVWPSVPYGA